MTAEEIRSIAEAVNKVAECEPLHQIQPTVGYSSSQFVVLREIAAQLAEQNELLRSMQIHIVPKLGHEPALVGLRVGVHEMRP